MRNTATMLAFALATTMAVAQSSSPSTQGYGVNQSGTQKITNGPVVEYTSDHSAMVAWSTKYPGGTYVAYGTDQNNLSQRTEKAWGGTNHRVEIKNLQPGTNYFFQVRSENAKGSGAMGADVESNVVSFTTNAKGQSDRANRNVGVNGTGATAASGTTGMPGGTAMPSSGQFKPLYRMTGAGGDHFYTTDPTEHASLQSGGKYRDEGVTGYLASSQIANSVPLYRLYLPTSADHLYTTNASERDSAARQGYKDEGTVGYIAQTQLPGTVPLYRMVNHTNNFHFYTSSDAEHQSVKQSGYQDEGIAGYVWSQPQ
jgi:Repeat of unknown function (DUF5648)/Purple acid Phosphatase, N-terminal domain